MIEFQRVSKRFATPQGGEVTALRDLDLEIATGELHCLIGTSGCGKSTTLRLVNRLETPSSGRVSVGGEDVAGLDVIRLRRRIGYVTQAGGLFPHMTVAQNIGLLCELEGWDRARIDTRVRELLSTVNLADDDYTTRYPHELSGGQQQRVGLARALALDPEYVLLDEPFSALDPITRRELHGEFGSLQRELHKTLLMVTHDLDEAFALADRVSIMSEGRVLQTGTEAEILSDPADEFVAEFTEHHRGPRHA